MKKFTEIREGLWSNIHAKRARIKAGSGERMRKPFSKGAPTKDQLQTAQENFQDGRNPQDKGDSARHGIPKKASIAQLMKIRSSKTASPRKKQLAHWQINMRKGKMNEGASTSYNKPDEQLQETITKNYVVEQISRQKLKEYNEIHKNNKLTDLTRKESKLFNDYKHADFQDKSKPDDEESYHPESALLNGFLKHHYDNNYKGNRYSHPDQNPSDKIKAMDDVLKRHKTDREMSVYTGIRSAPRTDENGHAHLPGYTSTSLSPSVANDFAFEKSESDQETHMLHIKLPAGSHAASMHYVGGRDREHQHEHEILMARGYTIKIHPVPKIVEDSFGATKHHIWQATVVKHDPKNLIENYNSKNKKLLTQSYVTIQFEDKEVKLHLSNTNKGKSSERKVPMLDTVFGKEASTHNQFKRAVNEAPSTSYNKPDEHTGVMSYKDLEAHIGKPKALLVAKHEQFQKHLSPQMSLGAQVGFKFERRHGFESVYAVHGPNKYVDKEKPGYRTMLQFHLSGSGKKVIQVDRSVNHNNERHHEGSLVWNHRETWEHPVNKRENEQLAKRLAKS